MIHILHMLWTDMFPGCQKYLSLINTGCAWHTFLLTYLSNSFYRNIGKADISTLHKLPEGRL